MPIGQAAVLLLGLAAAGFADIDITLVNPNFGKGICTGGSTTNCDPNLFTGDPEGYSIQSANLQSVLQGDGSTKWTAQIDTNYGTDPGLYGPSGWSGTPPVMPTGDLSYPTTQIPSFVDGGSGGGGVTLFLSDFLINQGNNYIGIVLSPHGPLGDGDTYTPGGVYELTEPVGTSGFIDAPHFNTTFPVALKPGGSPVASGTINVENNPACTSLTLGTTCPEYIITETFTTPSGFNLLDEHSPFALYASSADCGNGHLSSVPEPRYLSYLAPFFLAAAFYALRRKRRSVTSES